MPVVRSAAEATGFVLIETKTALLRQPRCPTHTRFKPAYCVDKATGRLASTILLGMTPVAGSRPVGRLREHLQAIGCERPSLLGARALAGGDAVAVGRDRSRGVP